MQRSLAFLLLASCAAAQAIEFPECAEQQKEFHECSHSIRRAMRESFRDAQSDCFVKNGCSDPAAAKNATQQCLIEVLNEALVPALESCEGVSELPEHFAAHVARRLRWGGGGRHRGHKGKGKSGKGKGRKGKSGKGKGKGKSGRGKGKHHGRGRRHGKHLQRQIEVFCEEDEDTRAAVKLCLEDSHKEMKENYKAAREDFRARDKMCKSKISVACHEEGHEDREALREAICEPACDVPEGIDERLAACSDDDKPVDVRRALCPGPPRFGRRGGKGHKGKSGKGKGGKGKGKGKGKGGKGRSGEGEQGGPGREEAQGRGIAARVRSFFG